MRFEKILCLFDSKTWDLCQERVKFTRFILSWDYMIVTLGLVLNYCYEAVLDGLVIAILWLLNLVKIDSFQKFCHIIESASVCEFNSNQRRWFTKNEAWFWQYWQVHAQMYELKERCKKTLWNGFWPPTFIKMKAKRKIIIMVVWHTPVVEVVLQCPETFNICMKMYLTYEKNE